MANPRRRRTSTARGAARSGITRSISECGRLCSPRRASHAQPPTSHAWTPRAFSTPRISTTSSRATYVAVRRRRPRSTTGACRSGAAAEFAISRYVARSARRSRTDDIECANAPTLPSLRRAEDLDECERQDPEVEPQRPVLDVVVVPLHPVGDRRLPAQAMDLGPTGDPGLDAVALLVACDLAREALDEFRPFRTRTDEAHVAAQD